jgi:hypothetical protein
VCLARILSTTPNVLELLETYGFSSIDSGVFLQNQKKKGSAKQRSANLEPVCAFTFEFPLDSLTILSVGVHAHLSYHFSAFFSFFQPNERALPPKKTLYQKKMQQQQFNWTSSPYGDCPMSDSESIYSSDYGHSYHSTKITLAPSPTFSFEEPPTPRLVPTASPFSPATPLMLNLSLESSPRMSDVLISEVPIYRSVELDIAPSTAWHTQNASYMQDSSSAAIVPSSLHLTAPPPPSSPSTWQRQQHQLTQQMPQFQTAETDLMDNSSMWMMWSMWDEIWESYANHKGCSYLDESSSCTINSFCSAWGSLAPKDFNQLNFHQPQNQTCGVLPDGLVCSVCLDSISAASNFVETSCGHVFHSSCMKSCFKFSHSCPNCRHVIPSLPCASSVAHNNQTQ